jgi:hypothetical protein
MPDPGLPTLSFSLLPFALPIPNIPSIPSLSFPLPNCPLD